LLFRGDSPFNRISMAAFERLAARLAEVGRQAHARGWALGTSGNFSAVVQESPLRLAITASGLDKAHLAPDGILEVDGGGRVVRGRGRPSAETSLHLAIVRARGAGAVVHTHSLWSTLLSETHSRGGGVALDGYELLKGLAGIDTHNHREWLPIVENAEEWDREAGRVETLLRERPDLHGFLIRGHGLYTWGRNLDEAERHLEVLEFLLEVVGRAGRNGHA
jgi:methylthioribulose-1-phosphate dehydratase